MTLILDSGAFVALERGERAMWRRLKAELVAGRVPLTHGGVVGQVWRGRGRARRSSPRRCRGSASSRWTRPPGEPLGTGGGADVIDAAVVLLAQDGDRIVTSDPDDLEALARAAGRQVALIQA